MVSRQVACLVRVAEKTLSLTGDEANALQQRSKVVWSEARLATQGTLADQAQEGELSMSISWHIFNSACESTVFVSCSTLSLLENERVYSKLAAVISRTPPRACWVPDRCVEVMGSVHVAKAPAPVGGLMGRGACQTRICCGCCFLGMR